MTRKNLALGLAIVVGSSCGDDPDVTPPVVNPPFSLATYVAIGNSLTAGFQSGGINDSLQMLAYPVLVAQQMGLTIGSDFIIPSLAGDGCAPPIENIFTQSRVNGGAGNDCFGRAGGSAAIPHNLGVPGAHMLDAVSLGDPRSTTGNPYFGLFAGTMTPLEAAATLNPTFVSIWLGGNDILGAATTGDLGPLTSFEDFESDLLRVVEAVDFMHVTGAIMIGVPHVTTAPFFSPAAAYWVGDQMGALPPTMTVSANCATTAAGGLGEATLVPFSYGFGALIGPATAGATVTLDCQTDPMLLHLPEIAALVGASARYNTIIKREAEKRGWAYWDPNPTLDSAAAAGGTVLFPNTMGADALFIPFGSFLSRDGIHPSTLANRVIANHIIDAINTTYNRTIPRLP